MSPVSCRWSPLLLFVAALSSCALERHGNASGGNGSDGALMHRPPNIVVILADDMGFGDPGCFNRDSKIATPHIDRLANEGVRFVDAHSPGAWCVPSRYGLLTGRYPARKKAFRAGRQAVIAKDRVTLASLLNDRGYRTAMVGKWHLGFDGGAKVQDRNELHGGPLDRGFDSFFGIHASLDIPPYYYIRDRRPVLPPSGEVEASATAGWSNIQGAFWRAGGLAPDFVHAEVLPKFTDEAIAVLNDAAQNDPDRPFFLYLALAAPHTPWLPQPDSEGRSRAGMYGDFVADVDDAVGRVLQALDRNDQSQDTLIVFTSDNGPVWYPADVERLGHSSTGPWRGMKSDSWEGGHRMPFVVRWPGNAPAGSTTHQTVCFTDLMATCAELTGAPLPAGAGEDSHSLVPVLRDPKASTTREHTLLKASGAVVRAGRWKLVTHLGSGGFSKPRRLEPSPNGPAGQLYDLDNDPGEATNLWLERPDVVARLHQLRERILAGGTTP